MKHIDIVVTGKVQGVGFRFSAMREAYNCKVCGYVTNRSDGSVFMEAEGEEPALTAFLDWCRKGPLGARITEVTISESPLQGYQSFDIRSSQQWLNTER